MLWKKFFQKKFFDESFEEIYFIQKTGNKNFLGKIKVPSKKKFFQLKPTEIKTKTVFESDCSIMGYSPPSA